MNQWFFYLFLYFFLQNAHLDHCHYCLHMLTSEFSDTPFGSIITQSQLSCQTDMVILAVSHKKGIFIGLCRESLHRNLSIIPGGNKRVSQMFTIYQNVWAQHCKAAKIKGINAVSLHHYEAKVQFFLHCPSQEWYFLDRQYI